LRRLAPPAHSIKYALPTQAVKPWSNGRMTAHAIDDKPLHEKVKVTLNEAARRLRI
jgi:hypothetical protein